VVNVNPLYTARELDHQLRDSQAKAMIVFVGVAPTFASIADRLDLDHVLLIGPQDLFLPAAARPDTPEGLDGAIWFHQAVQDDSGGPPPAAMPQADDLAFLQYTSGSTATPKGVAVSHGSLLHNQEMIRRAFGHSERSSVVGWLPLFHDMGLIGNVLQPLYAGIPCVLMPPMAFLQRPIRWLRAISHYRATSSGGPNFAYEHCLRKLTPESLEGLDLSCWEAAFNGAEPVRAQTLERFAEALRPHGFRRQAFFPCYGLAEATLLVTGGGRDRLPVLARVRSSSLEARQVEEEAGGLELVSSGPAWGDQEVAIVDPDTRLPCPPDRVGEIWVKGPSVALGYWNQPERTRQTFGARLADSGDGPFLRTGDLGFLRAGELFVTGRIKDLIILRGRNLYPQDIELAAQRSHEALRPGCGAAFSVEGSSGEQLVVVHEIDHRACSQTEVIAQAIRLAVAESFDVEVQAVVLLGAGRLPKTTSGKIQRSLCRKLFLADELEEAGRSVLATSSEEEAPTDLDEASLGALEPAARRAALESALGTWAANALRRPAAEVSLDLPLAALGLDSLGIAELQTRIQDHLGLDLSLGELFEAASLSALAGALLERREAPAPPGRQEPIPGSSSDRRSLSHGQRALWFLHRLSPESPAYNISFAARILSGIPASRLRLLLQRLADRHPALCATFPERKGEPEQRPLEAGEIRFRVVDAAGWTPEELGRRVSEAPHLPFSLEEGPIFRAILFARSPLSDAPSREEDLNARGSVLLVSGHHIVLDLWSMVVMVEELRQGDALPAPAASYGDYVAWQRALLAGTEGERLRRYWHRRLSGELPLLELPLDRPRSLVQSFRGGEVRESLGARASERLESYAKGAETTLFTVLLAALQVTLQRYSGQADVLVGSPATGRTRPEWHRVVGYFANMLVLRGDLSGDPSFESLLSQLRGVVLEALDHQDFPFSLLVEELQPARDSSLSPFFQVAFVLEKPHREPEISDFVLGHGDASLQLGELELQPFDFERRATPFDITLSAVRLADGLQLSFSYNADLFDATTLSRMAGAFRGLLETVVETPAARLSELPLLAASERHQLLVEWNDTASDFPRESIAELFVRVARDRPDAVALVSGDQRISYRELDRRSNRLARFLRRHGVDPAGHGARPVALCLERSPEMVVALLAILKAGGAYVPIDPDYPAERCAFLVEDVGADTLVTDSELQAVVPGFPGRTILLDRDADDIAAEPDTPLEPSTGPRDLAYVLFTSGSTGRPKGVAVEHRSVVRLVRESRFARLGPEEVLLLLAPVSFDASTLELWGSLLNGGSLVVFPAGKPSLEELGETLRRHGVSTLWLTAGLFHLMVDQRLEDLASLRQLLAGGDVLSPGHLRRLLAAHPHCLAINGYGPTENTTFTTTHAMGRPEEVADSVSIGRPIASTRVYVLDPGLRPVPIGVAGQLWAAGEGLARGYFRRPALTAAAFVPDPFAAEPGARLYRTGDRVRLLADGRLEFLGRIDGQVKIRGFRVEPGEIETVLATHPAVREVVVVPKEDPSGGRRLVAYWVAEAEAEAPEGSLKTWLRERLPEHLVPSVLVRLEALPLTANGKVDRRALPDPEGDRSGVAATYTAPRTPVEELLAAIWSELLGVERVGLDDDFFELGGHSLLATQVVSRV
ncbi:MAG: amino acid adenylation domain-containing protein, partial [Acidobacteria bacterium]|nr:amino acid adenylation domain-containing protein [Acidobacteriota bacterium]